ncbi:hypothetical protein [Alteromonas sp. a30]|uniref:hypothetical protein n=1 Tax=Alteromonas sp. a30 TaxID=2730917 RepID=UPI0022819EBB|nr:hypothetical protein [Alteromonas sp. a30]MCY7295007.1 hypothetical protein [Alteromonas sp. a30]
MNTNLKHPWVLLSLFISTLSFSASSSADNERPKPAVPKVTAQVQFTDAIKEHCGKAYAGKVKVDNQPSAAFTNKSLVMHVMKCEENRVYIPFHVGNDHSRTWILTHTGSGLSLKHDHRKPSGKEDNLTQYGGHTINAGWPQIQSFPADAFTQELFANLGLPQSIGNTWHMYIYPEKFTYRLTREGREFSVEFDLTKPIALPPTPWGY